MPQNIRWDDFSAGWVPSDNEINGRKNGLLQMDNVDLDENGAVVMTGGTSFLSSGYGSSGNVIFSRFMGSTRMDYVHTASGSVWRNGGILNSGGNTDWCAFGTAFDYVLYCTGTVRKKDDGSAPSGTKPYNLGIARATDAPSGGPTAVSAPFCQIGPINIHFSIATAGDAAIITDEPGKSPYMQLTADGDGNAILQSYNIPGAPFNANQLVGTGANNTGNPTDRDSITLAGYLTNPWGKAIQFDVLLAPGNANGDIVGEYYTYVVKDLAREATFNTDGSFSIRMKRIEFIRNGPGYQGWSTVYGYRISFKGLPGEKINILGNAAADPIIKITGGDKSQDGTYQYMQINVNKSSSYIGKSPKGQESTATEIRNSQAIITPINPTTYDPQCNEAWIYRKGGALDAWYRVLVTSSYVAQPDMVSDDEALKINIKWNENLVSISSSAIPEPIMAIVGPIESRWYYFTSTFLYPSELNNPDLVDASIAIRLTGSSMEKFMWAHKVSERTILVGTTNDIYILTGTFVTQPDFTVDIYYDCVGSEYPPIAYNSVENSDGVFYIAKDGWRVAAPNGNSSTLVAPNTDLLYDNQSRHGYAPPNLNFAPGNTKFPVTIAKNKMWCVITGTGRLEVYDFTRKYWRTETFSPPSPNVITAITNTQDGKILAMFTDNTLREIDSTTSKLFDGSGTRSVNMKSLILDNETPFQRKDSMVLKLKLTVTSTGGGNGINVYVTGNDVEVLVTTIANTTIEDQEFNIDLSVLPYVALSKSYQFRLAGNVTRFKLVNVEVWFETRPVPVTFTRIQSLNYGNVARKRLYSIPFVVDTTNNNVVFTPIVDGIAQTPMNVSCNYKATFNYKSVMLGQETDIIGRDFEYTLHATTGTYEFFALPDPRVLEIVPDPIKSFIVPHSNYGTTSRKRLRVLRFILDSLGNAVRYTPVINGVDQPSTTYTTNRKQTLFHYFTSDQIGVDWAGRFEVVDQNMTFEMYEVLQPQEDDIEVFPDTVEFHIIPPNNYGTDNKKYLRSISMVIDTHNKPVLYTPIVDGTDRTPTSTFTTTDTGKNTVTHYFTDDNIGVDYGGRLESIANPKEPFELWGVLPPGDGDVTPVAASALYHRVLETNFGSPNKKRVRVWPFVINTHGQNVAFYPYVDCQGVAPESIFNTNCKKTVWHFFNSDVFGVDYGGVFISQSGQIFDLWEVVAPDIVQVLPIARRFDQVGPQELFRYGKIKQMEIRVLPFNEGDVSSIPVVIYFNDNTIYETEFVVDNNKEASYFLGVPKGTAGNIVRIEIGPTNFNFHRFYMRLQAARSGVQTELEWVSLETGTHQKG